MMSDRATRARVSGPLGAYADGFRTVLAECGYTQRFGGGPAAADGARQSLAGRALLVTKHASTARDRCPSVGAKTVSPHVLRHSTAMRLLRAGVDTSGIALLLGQVKTDTVQIYLHADLSMKERALALTAPVEATPGRYRPPDALLTFLEAL